MTLALSQSHEINLLSKYGITFAKPYKPLDDLTTLADFSIFVNYNYRIFENKNLFINVGASSSVSVHSKVTQLTEIYNPNLLIYKRRKGINLGLKKQLVISKDSSLLLDLGIDYNRNFTLKSNTVIQKTLNWRNDDNSLYVQYDYEFESFQGREKEFQNRLFEFLRHNNLILSANVKYKFKKNMYINFGLGILTNHAFLYKHKVIKRTTDLTSSDHEHETEFYNSFTAYGNRYRESINNFYHLSFGLSWKF